MNDYAFGNFLYQLRTEKGLSQAQLGEMLGVTNKAVSKWETGSAKPNTSLLSRLADILGVTVEELFACKRIEQDSELENLKNLLCVQKRKAAMRTAAALSLVITMPLILFDFIFVIASFAVDDEWIGPLGSVGIIIAFVISLTSYIIHRGNFRRTIISNAAVCDERYISLIRKWNAISVASILSLFAILITIVCIAPAEFINGIAGDILFAVTFILMTLCVCIFVCCQSLKRLHKLKFVRQRQERQPFKQWPLWTKICYCLAMTLFLLSFPLQYYGMISICARGLSIVLLAILIPVRMERTE
ncbi:MAG: helix-turn-helix transcriptional regulator [Oscillospiraceae bacterium]|nr:helix-turn-helix transcriptional regulator [Oscillospiraceae bacterium]